MSIEVALDELWERITGRGRDAYLVTVRATRPHVVQVTVARRGEHLVVAPGRRTAANVAEWPEVTLLWPVGPADPSHSLIVDGRGAMSADGEWLEIVPTSAVLHRVGGRRVRAPDDV